MLITTDLVMLWRPCPGYTRERVEDLLGAGLTPLQVSMLNIPPEDRLWMLIHEDIISAQRLHELACQFAERALPTYERAHPDDPRPRAAIVAKRAWLRGEIADDQLSAAGAAARTAAWTAAWTAAGAAAWTAAWAAAWTAAQESQLDLVRAVLRELESKTC